LSTGGRFRRSEKLERENGHSWSATTRRCSAATKIPEDDLVRDLGGRGIHPRPQPCRAFQERSMSSQVYILTETEPKTWGRLGGGRPIMPGQSRCQPDIREKPPPAQPQVRGSNKAGQIQDNLGAPGRIRTCAPASGGSKPTLRGKPFDLQRAYPDPGRPVALWHVFGTVGQLRLSIATLQHRSVRPATSNGAVSCLSWTMRGPVLS